MSHPLPIRNSGGVYMASDCTDKRDRCFRVGRPCGHFHGDFMSARWSTTRLICTLSSARPTMMLDRQALLASIALTLHTKLPVSTTVVHHHRTCIKGNMAASTHTCAPRCVHCAQRPPLKKQHAYKRIRSGLYDGSSVAGTDNGRCPPRGADDGG